MLLRIAVALVCTFLALAANAQFVSGTITGTSTISVTPTGQVFTQNGALIQRINDRLMIGAATVSDQAIPNVTQDWLTQYQIGWGLGGGTLLAAQGGVLNSNNNAAGVGFLAGVQSKYFTSSGTNALASSGYAVNDNATLATPAWAFYGEAHKVTAASGDTYGMELDTRTLSSVSAARPFVPGGVVALQLASGAGLSATGQYDAAAAIEVAANPKKFQTGIVFGATSITGTDGVTGSGTAIALAKGHTLGWYSNDNAESASISSQVSAGANAVGLQFNDNGVEFIGPSSSALGYWFRVNSAVNYPTIAASTTGNPVVIGAGGSDSDVGIRLAPKGAGVVNVVGAISATTSGTMPLYGTTGTVANAPHMVRGTVTLAGGSATVTLSSSAVFSSSSSYTCTANDTTSAAAVKVGQTSGTSITFTGTGTDVIGFVCAGS